eukprot:TRINITY_DN64290_c0_g1_i1.p1 TRINITY_DN64290_c0_g1~~TRINITY_DN64290_c0_g1_i1.p1  ORF type:complete len:355 (-),score=99.61 TRINITY_DN64290_c0_g1_i1:128-1192(-)
MVRHWFLPLLAWWVSRLQAETLGPNGEKLPPAPPPVKKKVETEAKEAPPEAAKEAVKGARRPKKAAAKQSRRQPRGYPPPRSMYDDFDDFDGFDHYYDDIHPDDLHPPPMYDDFHEPSPPPRPAQELTKAQVHFLFPKIDKNQDGKMTLDELQAFSEHTAKQTVSKGFRMPKGLDKDKDGAFSLEELQANLEKEAKMEREEKVSEEQIAKDATLEKEKFALADANKDSKLTGDEILAFFHPDMDHELSLLEVRAIVEDDDADKDGKLSQKEYPGPGRDFKAIDTDKDGFVSAVELQAWKSGLQEFKSVMQKLMTIADKDGDGLTLSELLAARGAIKKTRANGIMRSWARTHEDL